MPTRALWHPLDKPAAGFVLKRIRDLDLVETIRSVGRGGDGFDDPRSETEVDDAVLARLSPRETAILEQIADGKTNREIAESLFLAEKTVKNYVSNLLAKMGISHRAAAAAYFARSRSRASSAHPPTSWP